MHKQNFIKIHSLFLKIEILTSIKGHNSAEKLRKISGASHNTAYTKCFGKKNINVTTRFDQTHQSLHKILSIHIILKSVKDHNSVEKFEKIMCISHNMDHIYQCINKILSKAIHYF